MIRHIVLWQFKEEAEGHSMFENFQTIKTGLEALVGKAPGLRMAEVGLNFAGGDYNVCLYSEFESKEALAVYQSFPEHLKVREFVHKVVSARVACDTEF